MTFNCVALAQEQAREILTRSVEELGILSQAIWCWCLCRRRIWLLRAAAPALVAVVVIKALAVSAEIVVDLLMTVPVEATSTGWLVTLPQSSHGRTFRAEESSLAE
jgi:hypothetical protein